MLFITNRIPTQGIQSKEGRKFDFDLKNNAPSNSVFYCERHDSKSHKEIGSATFFERLKTTSCRQILIYLHGFSNLPEDVFRGAQELQMLCDGKKDGEVMVVPMIWPCDDDKGIVEDYWDDQKSADASGFSFSRVLERFLKWRDDNESAPHSVPCLKRINILAHSMGNRVLRATLKQWNYHDLADGVPLLFRNTFLVAADIVNEALEAGQEGELICHSSRNVIVYHASDDLALRASKAANLKNKIASRRLGHTGPENILKTPTNVYSVDCDDVNTSYDKPTGHTYFRHGRTKGKPGSVFEHIFGCLLTGRAFPEDPAKRSTIIKDS
jgi:esterase/lipase superfamily enzyme